jgi:hypothetical protein
LHRNKLVRQTERWLSIVFTVTVITNFIFMALEQSPRWLVRGERRKQTSTRDSSYP